MYPRAGGPGRTEWDPIARSNNQVRVEKIHTKETKGNNLQPEEEVETLIFSGFSQQQQNRDVLPRPREGANYKWTAAATAAPEDGMVILASHQMTNNQKNSPAYNTKRAKTAILDSGRIYNKLQQENHIGTEGFKE